MNDADRAVVAEKYSSQTYLQLILDWRTGMDLWNFSRGVHPASLDKGPNLSQCLACVSVHFQGVKSNYFCYQIVTSVWYCGLHCCIVLATDLRK